MARSEMYAEMKCWDVSLNQVLRASCWDMRCALTWVLRVRYWSTCPSLSGLRTLPSPPPASSKGPIALMSVNQEPTQHYNKVSRDQAYSHKTKRSVWFPWLFKRNIKWENGTKTKPFIFLKQYILAAFISYPSISLTSLNDWLQVTDLLLVWLFTWKYPLNWL